MLYDRRSSETIKGWIRDESGPLLSNRVFGGVSWSHGLKGHLHRFQRERHIEIHWLFTIIIFLPDIFLVTQF